MRRHEMHAEVVLASRTELAGRALASLRVQIVHRLDVGDKSVPLARDVPARAASELLLFDWHHRLGLSSIRVVILLT